MAGLNTLLFLIIVALSVVALIDCMLTERSRLRSFPRGAWAVLILLCPIFGAVAWFRAGRIVPGAPAQALATPAGRPVGPEDDPEFVRMLADSIRNR
ncbi:PLD nuclease N-terminal domain-containing protein [Actinoplanes sp. NEAU-A12]|uniref:PLD nuclease N-terminal domain-containing protein n=1 Tax=Actinoplanes sandaracinus TaxID=3045177 RepID=A0ABT6WPJ5_9ACTN|nr:PLD nuclease N-terminal domain-containing protein [Actinoplanes sandaracinus]MDI6101638.1 PLD nuclease N-terminal domain-containing protein [Actinoplanes sandaracinus]